MRHNIILIILTALIAPVSSHAASIIEQADSAYVNDDFNTAARLYTEAIDSLGSSPELYFNLGNAYYRLGKNGMAIANYERALRLDPTNKDARENLEFVNTKITDRVGDSGTFISNSYNRIVSMAHPDTWALIGLSTFIVMLACVALYVFSSNIVLRKTGFFGGFILLMICVATNILAYSGSVKARTHTTAVVTEPSTILSTSPRTPKDRSEEAFLLHEGTKVEILDSVSTASDDNGTKWYEVSVDNTHRAWISSNDIEKI